MLGNVSISKGKSVKNGCLHSFLGFPDPRKYEKAGVRAFFGKMCRHCLGGIVGKRLKEGKKKRSILLVLIAAVLAGLAVLAEWVGLGGSLDTMFRDSMYQSESAPDGKLLVVGIDDYAEEVMGPYQNWTRADMADVVAALNADPEAKPAVIAIDVMYFGEKEPEADNYFAEVCAEGGNVVVGSLVNFTSDVVVEEDGSFSLEDYLVAGYEEPYEALKEATHQGNVNTMLDSDGIIRHAIQKIELPDGSFSNSLAFEAYQRYAEKMGLEMNPELPVNERYQWYIPFSGKPGTYLTNSVADILEGTYDPDLYKDSIVLIGPYSTGLQDDYFTSISKDVKMYGVEIHANIINAMLQGKSMRYISRNIQYLLLFLIVFLCVVLCYRFAVSWKTAVLWILCTGGYLGICYLLAQKGYMMHLIYVPISATLICIGFIAYHYIIGAIEKHKVMDTFKHYVAPQVVDELMKQGTEGLELGGKLTDIACLFVDIRGFTTMSEMLEPPKVVEILNRYLTLTSSCILNNEGTLDKFVGDATMAIFNAPLPQEDYIYRAVKTAWDMVEGSKELSRELQEKYGRTVSFGVGVHCGKAVVGNIGAEIRMDYTAIGDTVNTAARLESNAKAGEVLISRDVYDALQGRIRAVSLGSSIQLKGKSRQFEIFHLEEVL